MKNKEFRITGRVLDQTGQGIEGLRIEAWDKDALIDDLLGSALSGKSGSFTIEFDKRYYQEIIFDRKPDLYFKIFQNDELIKSTEDSVLWNVEAGEREIKIKVDIPAPSQIFKVKGAVLQPDGTPVVGATVKAFDKDLRHEDALGEVTTNQAGEYEVTYTREQFHRAEKKSADLIVRAYDKDGTELASSSIIFNAKLREEVNLTLSGEAFQGPSDYETLLQALTPVLDGVQPADLTEDDITFLTDETDIDLQRIHCLNRAAKLALTVDHSDLPTEVFYGFARKGLPTRSLTELLSRPLPVLRGALEEALQENIVAASLQEQLDAIIAALQAFMVQQASVAHEPGSVTFTALLETSESLDSEKRDRLLEFLASYRGSVENLWTELEQGTEFSPQEVEGVRLTLQFGTLSRNYLPMVIALQTLRHEPLPGFSDQPIQEIRELARFSAEDWLGLILDESNDPPIGFPPDTPGTDDAEKARNYAEQLFRQVEVAFPTAAVAYQLKGADTAVWNWGLQLSEFLLENPDFDLKTTRIEPYLQQLPRLLSRSGDTNNGEETKEELKTMQRLFQVTPRFDHIHRLRQAGFNSARGIARLTRESFLDRYGADFGGNEAASKLYETASDRVAAATNVWSKWSWEFGQALPAMIPPVPTPPPDFIEEQIPNWSELFGSPDYCTCKHCRSIYSPAAYFVELLQFLENESTYQSEETSGLDSGYTNALDLLLSRRPDLEHIELTCANTDTPLPYIDLVNEILERAAAPTLESTDWPQTTWSAEELAANPERVQRAAYESVLSDAIYPWDLPFDLCAEETRIYLKHLGVPRSQLIEVFLKNSSSPGAAYLNEDIVREYLGITEQEWLLLRGQTYQNESQWPALWGLTGTGNEIPNPYDTSNVTISGTWDEVLRHCWILLKRSGITLAELKELLRLRSVNPQGSITMEGEEDCRIQDLRLQFTADDTEPLSSDEAKAAFRRICLFVRLHRRLGWSVYKLDQALAAFDKVGQDDDDWHVDQDFIKKTSHVQRLRERLGVPLQEMLCWWGDIPTSREGEENTSLFEKLFLNNSVLPKEASPDDWQDFEDLLSYPTPEHPKPITTYLPRLTAALGASADDILFVLSWDPWSAPEPGSDWDVLTLPNLSRLFRILSLCRALKLSVRESVALIEMRGQDLDPFSPLFDDPKPTQNLLLLVDDLQKVRSSGFQIAELDYLLRHRLQSPETEEADLRETSLVLEQLRAGLQKIDPAARETDGRSLIKQHLIQVLKLEPAITERLLGPPSSEMPEDENEPLPDAWVKAAETDRDSIEAFLDDVFLKSDTLIKETFAEQRAVRDSLPKQYGTLIKLKKVATMLSRFRLTMKEARYLFEGSQSAWLDLNTLPVVETRECDLLYSGWSRLVDVCNLRDRIGAMTPDLFDLFDMAVQEGADVPLFDLVPKRLGWKKEDFDALIEHFGYEQYSFRDERPFLRLEACFDLGSRIGVSISNPVRILDWADAGVSPEVAHSIKLAAKSKYDEQRWLEVAKPLQDGLRERKRQSLVAYLTGLWDWTPEQLYACYLIDVDMQACMITSRIKQAISSVQLFVQRCLIGLESGVDITPRAARWWNQWMKNYRVWEANRKIFAYPENWIEPELRDDKSPFFEELEKELRQNDITPETAEKAYLNYLEKLDRVSRLEIVAQHYDHESGRHYIFGRTPNTPHVYYFRYRDICRVWSPWEQIDLDIEADHLIPVVWNRRPYLFWPLFKEVSKKQDDPDGDRPYGQASKVWDVKIAWSEYWQGKWGEKKVTPVPLRPKGNRATTYFYNPTEYLYSRKSVGEIPVLSEEYLLGQYIVNIEGIGRTETYDLSISPQPYFGESKNASLFYLQPSLIDERLCLRIFYVRDFFLERERYAPTGELHFTSNTGKPLQLEYEETKDRFLPITDCGYIQDSALHASGGSVYFKAPTGAGLCEYVNSGTSPQIISSVSFWTLPSADKSERAYRLLFPQYRSVSHCFNYLYGSSADPAHYIGWCSPIIYQDENRSFLINPTDGENYFYTLTPGVQCKIEHYIEEYRNRDWFKYQIESQYHPYASYFIDRIYQGGVDGLLNATPAERLFRQAVNKVVFDAEDGYLAVHEHIIRPYPKEEITFEDEEAYALYNWELFFHIPLLIADRLSTNQQFEVAQKWFHYIFDPTEVIPPDQPSKGAWRFGPFFDFGDEQQRIDELMRQLNGDSPELADRVRRWRNNPFQPHLMARLRDGAPYMKTVVMKYIDNLIAWGDVLFRRDTIESINEATQLYILAASILGPRPQQLPVLERAGQTYAMLKDRLDAFGNALVPVENEIVQAGESESSTASLKLLPQIFSYEFVLNPDLWVQAGIAMTARNMAVRGQAITMALGARSAATFEQGLSEELSVGYQLPAEIGMAIPLPITLYFCIPANNELLGYWETVADRLFKIRHCMNIEGIVRELPLFEPPIEPGLLVRAAAAGIDLGSIVSDVSPSLPHYRFGTMLQKALELCADVKTLGGALLAALEKRDAEELSLLRSTHELRVLDALTEIKEQEVEEAQATVTGLERARESAELQRDHYASLEFMNPAEKQQLDLMAASMISQQVGQFLQLAASGARHVPDITVGYTCWGGVATARTGGSNEGSALEASAWFFNSIASMLNTAATQSSILGSYRRRHEDWDLKKRTAALEVKQIDKQITAAEIRLAIADKNRKNHELQTEQAEKIEEYIRSKFTNQELYDWMASQLSTVYFQSYQMAYDLAKRAEKAFQHELGHYDTTFVKFGYWDSLKKGLLSGERLHYDLKRMEAAYLDKNKREYEISKHISLAMLDPVALIKLKETGQCFVNLPEVLFDLDYPGQHMRRIKSVSLTIPCVTGPYTSVNCKLTLLRNEIRIHNSPTGTEGNYRRDGNGDDPRFKDNVGAIQSIATSGGQNDSGVFELNFRDERYLPFEGAGLISNWRIELPDQFRQFNYDTMSDIIFHISYTAREGGETLKNAAKSELENTINAMNLADDRTGLIILFSAKHNFPGEWHRFLNPTGAGMTHVLKLDLNEERFPHILRGRDITLNTAHFFLKLKEGFQYNDSQPLAFKLKKEGSSSEFTGQFITDGSPIYGLPYSKPFEDENETLEKWFIEVEEITPEGIDDLLLVFYYSIQTGQ
ncbi:MAG TPA: neuraminidase-like domain-containing protein [Desulfatiglandales bacterium]|nr:neuraminidase-like domain-containing protein [Desulfatiglandales bacterium]